MADNTANYAFVSQHAIHASAPSMLSALAAFSRSRTPQQSTIPRCHFDPTCHTVCPAAGALPKGVCSTTTLECNWT